MTKYRFLVEIEDTRTEIVNALTRLGFHAESRENFTAPNGVLVRVRPHYNYEILGWELASILTPKSEIGKGKGQAALDLIIQAAQASKADLYLTPEPVGHRSMSKAALRKWYCRNGFSNSSMMRRSHRR